MASSSSSSSETNGNGAAAASNASSTTYAVDIRYFLVMLLSAMSVFFTIGVLTAPTNPAMYNGGGNGVRNYDMSNIHYSIDSPLASSEATENDADTASTAATPQRRAKPKHSSEIGPKIVSGDLNERHVNFEQPSYEDLGTGQGAVQHTINKTEHPHSQDQQQHLPAGQHLLVDIKNVSPSFLNSEHRLATAMVSSVHSAGLTILSYHCHSLIPAGVSCVGVLLESHISFHTWPEEGVITLDLFTCGENPLLPVVPKLEELFGVPRSEEEEAEWQANAENEKEDGEVFTLWSHELRGFRHTDPNGSSTAASKTNYLDSKSDLASWVITPLDMKLKKQVVTMMSEFHRIDIWEVLGHEDGPSYEDAMKFNLTEGDPRWLTAEITSPNRLLFLNGILQCMKDNENEYHESLVQPAMFTHPNPKTVAIVDGGKGASIREVLKHNTVEKVVIIELDKLMIGIAREHLPYMSDCSGIAGVADNCFDDERVEVIIANPKTWFLEHYGDEGAAASAANAEKFDVMIFDAFEPQLNHDVYNDAEFIDALVSSLSDDGTIAVSLGEGHNIHDPRASLSSYAPREKFMKMLEDGPKMANGAMFVYEEAHTGQETPSAFLAACKSSTCRDLWYAEALVVDYAINMRMRDTEGSDKPLLLHFDGATQHSFQIPPRAWEEVYCRRDPRPFECDYRGLDLTKKLFEVDMEDEEDSSFKIVVSDEDDGGVEVTSVYAMVDIPKGSYIMPSDLAASFTITEYTHESLKANAAIKNTGDVSVIEKFLDYIEKHGHKTMSDGSTLSYVEVGASFMIRRSPDMDEVNIGRWMPEHPSGKQPVFSPVYDRHMVSFDVFLVATKDIKEGEEIVKPENLW